jgi:hypothetical protein
VAISELCFGPTIFFAKLSLFFLYLRLFKPSTWMRHLVFMGIALCAVVYAGTTIAFGVLCVRRPGESWRQVSTSDRCLRQTGSLNYVQGIFGLVSDIYIYILPFPLVMKLHMPLARKIAVLAIFATGLLYVSTSSVGPSLAVWLTETVLS